MPIMIYHTPYRLRSDTRVASALRPKRMLQAFHRLGYEVIEITGSGHERKTRIAQLRKQLAAGLEVDFCYSESATIPNSFTEKNHFPLRLFLERNFFRLLHEHHIPIGVFYRDIYWVYPLYKQAVPAIAYPFMQALYRWDVRVYNRYVDALFVPSQGYAENTPGLKVSITPNLPPGAELRLEKTQWHSLQESRKSVLISPLTGLLDTDNFYDSRDSQQTNTQTQTIRCTNIVKKQKNENKTLNLFYVGSVGGEIYDMTPLRQVLQRFPQIHLTICTPENDLWRQQSPLWQSLENVTVLHLGSDELADVYAQTDICLLFIKPGDYRTFAVPFKFYEYLGYGKPVIVSKDTYMATETERLKVGWTVDFSEKDLADLFTHLLENPQEITERMLQVVEVARHNTWEDRAQLVASTLRTVKREQGRRLLIASRIYQPEVAAAAFRLQAVQNAFLQNGWNVDVLTTRFQNARTEKSRKLNIFRAPALRDKSGYLRGYLQYLSFDLPLFFRLLFAKRPDFALIEPPPTTGVIARLACKLRKIPYFWYAPDIWSDAVKESASPVVAGAVSAMEKFSIRGARGVITVNQSLRNRLLQKVKYVNPQVVENGVDTRIYTPTGSKLTTVEREQFGIDKPYFIYAGTASEWQRAEIFAQAFATDRDLVQKTQLVFVGNGTAWQKISEIRSELAERGFPQAIIQLESQPPQVVAKMLRGALSALVSLSPDGAYDYAYPTKVFAALGCGTPVIYAGAGPAVKDIQTHKLGWTVSFSLTDIQQTMRQAELAIHNKPDEDFVQRAANWVGSNHSLQAAGQRVFNIVTADLR